MQISYAGDGLVFMGELIWNILVLQGHDLFVLNHDIGCLILLFIFRASIKNLSGNFLVKGLKGVPAISLKAGMENV